MRRKLISFIILLIITLSIVINYGDKTNYKAESDGIIEWNSYNKEKLV